MSSTAEAVGEVGDVPPLTAGRGGPDSWERDVRVSFGTETFAVAVRGSPLMSDDHAVEVARQAVVDALDPASKFSTGEVRPGERPDHKQWMYTEGELRQTLQDVADATDGVLSENRYDDVKPDDAPWSNVFRRRYGTWTRAREVILEQ